MRDRLGELLAETSSDKPGSAVPADSVIVDVQDENDSEPKPGANFMAAFFDKVKTIRDGIKQIESTLPKVETVFEQRTQAYDAKRTTESNEQLTRLMDDISRVANRVRKDLKAMDKDNQTTEQSPDGKMSADVRIRKSQHSTLSRKFVQVMTRYNDMNMKSKEQYRASIVRSCKIADPEASEETINAVLENADEQGVTGVFHGTRLAEAKAALQDIKDRHVDIAKLEKSLRELHEMFLDMAILVESQGDMIDRIEYSVEKSADYVEVARKELKQAERYQTSARHKQICLAICVLVLVVILIAVLASVVPNN